MVRDVRGGKGNGVHMCTELKKIHVVNASYYSSNILVVQEPILSLLQHMYIASLVQYLQVLHHRNVKYVNALLFTTRSNMSKLHADKVMYTLHIVDPTLC